MNNRFEVIAAGTVHYAAGVPAWEYSRGFADPPTDTAAGICGLVLDGGGCDATDCIILVSQRGAMAAQRLTTFATVHTSDTAKQITIMQETGAGGGAASAAADVDFSVAVIRCNS